MKLVMLMFCVLAVARGQAQPDKQEKPDKQESQEPAEFRFGTTVVIPTGLQGKIYHISEFAKKLPANLEKKKPAGSIYTTSLNIPTTDFRAGFPGVTKRTEWFAIDYSGKFWIEKPGQYQFFLTSDDGSKLYIDDREVIDNDGVHPTLTKDCALDLKAGVHKIRVSYFQGPGLSIALILEIAAPFQPRRVFSTEDYRQPSTVESLPSK